MPIDEELRWLDATAQGLARLAEAAPRLTLLLAIEPGPLARYLGPGHGSRARSLVRQGTVAVPALDGPEIGRRACALIPDATLEVIPGRHAPFLDDPGRCSALMDNLVHRST